MQEVEKDAAAVEKTLLALVAQACPDNESRASRLDAARSLIIYARSEASEKASQFSNSPELDNYPPELLRSCSALQPILGRAGVSDAFKVLGALHCRMQRLQATAVGQSEPCGLSQGAPAASEMPQGRSSASDPSVASASAPAEAERKTPVMKAKGPCAACVTEAPERSAINCSQQEAMPTSRSQIHDASAVRERTAQKEPQAKIPEKPATQQRQLPDRAPPPLQHAAKVRFSTSLLSTHEHLLAQQNLSNM